MMRRNIFLLGLLLFTLLLASCQNSTSTTPSTEVTTEGTTVTSSTSATTTATTPQEQDESLILWYEFNEGSGTTVIDSSIYGNNGSLYNTTWENHALSFNGENAYVDMPSGLLKDIEDITIIIEAFVDPSSLNPYWLYTFGSSMDAGAVANTKYLGLLNDGGNVFRASITTNRWTGEQNTNMPFSLVKGVWIQFTYTIKGNTAKLYQDGISVATNYNVSIDPDTIEDTIANYIGKPAYKNDRYFKGQVRDFKVYNRALTEAEVKEISSKNDQYAVNQDYEDFSLENINQIINDIDLPSRGENGSYITWTSMNTDYITSEGHVTRPSHESGNQTVELQARIKKGTFEKIKSFQATVLAELSDQEKLVQAKNKLSIPNSDDIRGNITLPTSIDDGITITWQSNQPQIISTTSSPAGNVTRPITDTTVQLSATLRLNGKTETKLIDVTVKALAEEKTFAAYLFAYFKGEYIANGEQIYFATSLDGLNWQALNQNTPVLNSNVGEKGVRDPFILRSPEGDKFYMIATDLSIYKNPDWWRAQSAASQSIVVWESADLINWSEPRLVKVAHDDAGCTWAPEFIYDEQTGEYMVYWASRRAVDGYAKQRIYYAKTRDFYTFTEPELYIERSNDVIDGTITFYNGLYYRFTKDESTKRIIIDTSDTLFGQFTPLSSPSLYTQTGVEGPLIFKVNNQNKWMLLLDNYGGEGYYPLITNDLTSGEFTRLSSSEYQLPNGSRHGSVIPITQEEYDALQNKWN